MRFRIISVGTQFQHWVETGIDVYQKRLGAWSVQWTRLKPFKRHKGYNIAQAKQKETQALLAASRPDSMRWALDVEGASISFESLAQSLKILDEKGQSLEIIIGGADGFAPNALDHVKRFRLSDLTLSHELVHLVLFEQLYRQYVHIYGGQYCR